MKSSVSFNIDNRLIKHLEECENRSKLVEELLAEHFKVKLNWVPDFIKEIGTELSKKGYKITYNPSGNYSLVGNHDGDFALAIRLNDPRNIYEVFVTRGERELKIRVSSASSAKRVRELYSRVFEALFENKKNWTYEDKLTHQGIQKKYLLKKEKPEIDMVIRDLEELLRVDFSKY